MNINHLATISAFALAATACTTMDDGMASDDMADNDVAMDMSDDDMDTSTQTTTAQTEPMENKPMVSTVGGAEMFSNRTIVENAMNSPIHTTLVAAVKAADLVSTLNGPGPFTVFAPTNDAFSRPPDGTVDTLLMPENKAQLQGVLTYHVVPGNLKAADLMKRIEAGGGTAMIKTVQGQNLSFTMEGRNMLITGANGNKSYVTQPNVMQSNGVIHVINGVLTPKM